jgi:hypothetical protein
MWLHFSMILSSNSQIPMGKYLVSPTTHQTANGLFRASIAVQRAQSKGAYCRVFKFNSEFVSREAARVYAITQGWLETCAPQPQPC